MIHYSVLPAEFMSFDGNQKEPLLKEIEIEGVSMMIQLDSKQEATIVRVLSMNPDHFIDPRFQPGNRVQFLPKINV